MTDVGHKGPCGVWLNGQEIARTDRSVDMGVNLWLPGAGARWRVGVRAKGAGFLSSSWGDKNVHLRSVVVTGAQLSGCTRIVHFRWASCRDVNYITIKQLNSMTDQNR